MESFIEAHRPLILRHAKAVVALFPEKCAAEDVAKEVEMVLRQLAKRQGLTPEAIHSLDPYLRLVAKHAFGRARRRRALLDQLAAGDDLDALSSDMTEVDGDLPPLPAPPSEEAKSARRTLDRLKEALTPSDALICALLLEDDSSIDDVSAWISMPPKDLAAARERILTKAASLGIEPERRADRRGA